MAVASQRFARKIFEEEKQRKALKQKVGEMGTKEVVDRLKKIKEELGPIKEVLKIKEGAAENLPSIKDQEVRRRVEFGMRLEDAVIAGKLENLKLERELLEKKVNKC